MELRKLILQKIDHNYGNIDNLINRLQNKKNLSATDKSIIDGFIIIGRNASELELPLLDDVFFYRDISEFVLVRLYSLCSDVKCQEILFIIELTEFSLEYSKQLRRLG